MVDRNVALQWKNLIQDIADKTITSKTLSDITYLELVSVEPLVFQKNSKTVLESEFIVTPKYHVFTKKDIGKKFVFQRSQGGQTFYFLYEPAEKGKNGKPYKWKGKVDKCSLKGTSPSGEVTVTHGTIDIAIHEEEVE